jgi:hypothetical protein
MSYAKPNAPLIENPINLDAKIQAIQLYLADALPWLDYSFGRAYRASRMDDAKGTIYYPEIYTGDGTYQEVTPNSHYGSHSFIQVSGPEKPRDYQKYMSNIYSVDLDIIFLFNLETIRKKDIYPYHSHHFTEELKRDVKAAITRIPDIDTITGIYETPEEVFKGYSYNHLAHQTFKHPNGGFKFGITTSFADDCVISGI